MQGPPSGEQFERSYCSCRSTSKGMVEIENEEASNSDCDQDSCPEGFCFDEAIGLSNLLGVSGPTREVRAVKARTKLVELALARASDQEFRALLAPEIRHLAAVTVEGMNNGLSQARGDHLPPEMCTQELQKLVNDFFNAPNNEAVRRAVAACNRALGRRGDLAMHLDDLKLFFQGPDNRTKHADSYKWFSDIYKRVVEPAETAFSEYCARRDTYKQYLQCYYGRGGWFAFQREFSKERSTSMVDVTAKLLGLSLVIYNQHGEVCYRTDPYGDHETHVLFNGVDHFTTPMLS